MSILDKWKEHKEKHGPRDDVLPCPRCGSTETKTTGTFRPLSLQVKCVRCEFRGPGAQTREGAILLWNGLIRK